MPVKPPCSDATGWCEACARCKASRRRRAGRGAGPPAVHPAARRELPCAHEGHVVEACKSCGPKEGRHVRQCLHPTADRDLCTRDRVGPAVQACVDCPDYAPADPA